LCGTDEQNLKWAEFLETQSATTADCHGEFVQENAAAYTQEGEKHDFDCGVKPRWVDVEKAVLEEGDEIVDGINSLKHADNGCENGEQDGNNQSRLWFHREYDSDLQNE